MKVRLWVMTDRVGSKVEREIGVDDEDWEDMDDLEKDRMMFDTLTNSSMIEWGYKVAGKK